MKAKVREFDSVRKTNFLGNDTPKENMNYTCIACITIDSVMRMDKKKMSSFINTELKSDSESESELEVESKSDTELMAKLKSSSDSDSE